MLLDPDDLLSFDGTFSGTLVACGIAGQTMAISFGLPLMRLTGSLVTSEYRNVVGVARCSGQFTLGSDDCSFSLVSCD